MSNKIFYGILTILLVAFLGLFISRSAKIKPTPEQPIVSNGAIHWHPQLAVYIKGKQQLIPPNIKGFVHTHDSGGVLHWEMNGPVRKNFLLLKFFFGTWGKTFTSSQIFDSKNGPNGIVKMTVNGQPNTEFENYQVKDKDQIEIRYD